MAGRRSVLLVALLAACALGGRAQSTTADLLNSLPPSGSLSTAVYFPEHQLKQFAAGDVITAVISAHNDASKPYNLTAVVASLNSPMDFSMYIQNFTYQTYFQELAAGEEASLEYRFMIARQVPTRDFTVAIHLLYEEVGGKGYHSNVVFNGTVEVVEKAKLVDFEMIFMLAMMLGTAGVIGYWALANSTSPMAAKLKGGRKGRRGDAKAAAFDEDEWVKGTSYEVDKRRKAAAAQAKLAAAKQS